MRTTISLDDDILLAVKERAGREKRSAGQVLSDLARQALTGQGYKPAGWERIVMDSLPCHPGAPPSPTP